MNTDYSGPAAVDASARMTPMLRELMEVRHLPGDDPRRVDAINEKHTVLGLIAQADQPEPNAGQQLDEIMKDMDAAYAAIREAGYPPLDSPEHEALEAVYVRLRAWNAARA